MGPAVNYTCEAESSFVEIAVYIALDNPPAAFE